MQQPRIGLELFNVARAGQDCRDGRMGKRKLKGGGD